MPRTVAPLWLFDINEYVDVLVFQVTARESNRVYSRELSQNPASLSLWANSKEGAKVYCCCVLIWEEWETKTVGEERKEGFLSDLNPAEAL